MSDTEKPAPPKGLEGVVAATTKLSSVRGLDGELIYRGYNINELAGKATYEEVVHLLHRGKLPNAEELASLKAELAAARELPGGVVDLIKMLPKKTSPMRAIRTAVSALACYEPPEAQDSLEDQTMRAIKLIAQVPVITAYFHLARQGKPLPDSDPSLGEAANFLNLIDGEKPIEEKEKTIDMCYILHADHGMNASTFSARVTIATLSGMYSAITSAIGTLKGPLHGGANEGVIKMLLEIGDLDKVDDFVADSLKNKKKIMGIGHRVYKVLDPRRAAPAEHGPETRRQARRNQVARHERAHRRDHAARKEPIPERRFLLRHGILLARHSDRPVHTDLCDRAHFRLDCTRARATGRQPPYPPKRRL